MSFYLEASLYGKGPDSSQTDNFMRIYSSGILMFDERVGERGELKV